LGVERQARAAYGFEHPLRRLRAVLDVVVEDDADREHDQRQRGSCDQQGEPYGEGGFWHELYRSAPSCAQAPSVLAPSVLAPSVLISSVLASSVFGPSAFG